MTQRTEPMLTPQDDLPGHQTPGTFAQAGNDDLRFTERWWYTAHPTDGRPLLIDVGFGYYPNRGVMDAFAGVTVGRRQHNFRASPSSSNSRPACPLPWRSRAAANEMACWRKTWPASRSLAAGVAGCR